MNAKELREQYEKEELDKYEQKFKGRFLFFVGDPDELNIDKLFATIRALESRLSEMERESERWHSEMLDVSRQLSESQKECERLNGIINVDLMVLSKDNDSLRSENEELKKYSKRWTIEQLKSRKERCVEKCEHEPELIIDYEDGTLHCLHCVADEFWGLKQSRLKEGKK